MRTPPDVLRSLKWYLSLYLDESFDVRADRVGSDRPVAVIKPAGAAIFHNQHKGRVDVTQPFALYVWPDSARDPGEAQQKAWEAFNLVQRAFTVGGENTGRPSRVPIYNYEGIDWEDVPGSFDTKQRITLPDGTTGGTFDLTIGENVAQEIPYNADASTMQAALESIWSGAITVTESGGVWTIVFDDHPNTVGRVRADGSGLDPGPNITLLVETLEAYGRDGYASIRDFTLEQHTDPEDDTLFTLTANLRLNWLAPGEQRTYQKIIGSTPLEFGFT